MNDISMNDIFTTLVPMLTLSGDIVEPISNVKQLMDSISNINPFCFNHDTKILCLNKNLEEEYVPIQNLRKGDLVKTYLHGYRKIESIGKGQFYNNPNDWKKCMYKMVKSEDNNLIDDLIVTGAHSILVNKLNNDERKQQLSYLFNETIDDKFLLLASVSNKFVKIEDNQLYTYYHLVPENNGKDSQRFGIWANGILTETPSKIQFIKYNYQEI
jgi:hypothetical protein